MRRLRLWLGAAALVAAVIPGWSALGSSPSAGTVSLSAPNITWTGVSWPVGVIAVAQRGVEPTCPTPDPASTVCDHYTLTVDVPASYWATNYGGVRVRATWADPNNKLEVAVHDATGKLVGWALNGGDSTVTIPAAEGTYDVEVVPTLVVRPMSAPYMGLAEIVPLSQPPAVPSLGGPAAYRATPVVTLDPDHPPANTAASYGGPQLQLVAHPVGHASFEPMLGVDNHGGVFIDTDDSQPFLPPVQNTKGQPAVYRSVDNGSTWTQADDAITGTFQTSTSDPYVYVDPDYGRVFWVNLELNVACCSFVSFTDDGGKTWTDAVATPGGLNDHPTLAAGPVPAGSGLVTLDPAFPKIVYYCVNQISDVGCTRSLDGGRTFERVNSPLLNQSTACGVSTMDHVTTDSSGRVFLGSSGCNVPLVANSTDGGITWTNVNVAPHILAAYHDVATAEDSAQNVYAAFTDSENSLPYLTVSRDHGMTWSTPVMVAAPGVHEIGMLMLSAGSPGRVAVGMVTTTVDGNGDQGRPWSYRVAVTQDALDPSPLFVSNVATIPGLNTAIVNRGDCCPPMADFLGLFHSPLGGGAVWGSLSDGCTNSACITQRNGANNLTRGRAYAVEQVAGPALIGPRRDLPKVRRADELQAGTTGPDPATAAGGAAAATAAITALPMTTAPGAGGLALLAIPGMAVAAGCARRRRPRSRLPGGHRPR